MSIKVSAHKKNGFLIRFMRNKYRFQSDTPNFVIKGIGSLVAQLWGRFEKVKCFGLLFGIILNFNHWRISSFAWKKQISSH